MDPARWIVQSGRSPVGTGCVAHRRQSRPVFKRVAFRPCPGVDSASCCEPARGQDLRDGRSVISSGTVPVARLMCAGLLLLNLTACGSDDDTPADTTATVAGVDADNDGVRDDIETYIDQTYSGGTDGPTRNALRQYAKAAQAAMLEAGDQARSVIHAEERFRAIECLMARRPSDFPKVFSDLRARILNTDLRSKAYLQADGQVTATQIALLSADQWLSVCVTQ